MNWLMRKCSRCGKYFLVREKCPYCGGEPVVPHPSRFSPVDKYVVYRLKAKLEGKTISLDEKPSYVP